MAHIDRVLTLTFYIDELRFRFVYDRFEFYNSRKAALFDRSAEKSDVGSRLEVVLEIRFGL